MATETLDTYNKALAINLDVTIFGTFAEIGAGQETSRWFLRVGAASGTVAKTISAYDKAVSDDLYGAGERYVSRQRLGSMLSAEWSLLQNTWSSAQRARGHSFSPTRYRPGTTPAPTNVMDGSVYGFAANPELR